MRCTGISAGGRHGVTPGPHFEAGGWMNDSMSFFGKLCEMQRGDKLLSRDEAKTLVNQLGACLERHANRRSMNVFAYSLGFIEMSFVQALCEGPEVAVAAIRKRLATEPE